MRFRDYNLINWKDIVYYDHTSPSFLRWKVDIGYKIKANTTAGSLSKSGYYSIGYGKSRYSLHRVIYLLHYERIDGDLYIDHIDGNPKNNNINNLRTVSNKVNGQNTKKHCRNTSGVTGVYLDKNYNRWTVHWYDIFGKRKVKHYSFKKYGDNAFNEACRERQRILQDLNDNGADYTDRHGL